MGLTRHIVCKDQHVIKVLKLIGDSQLAESLSVRDLGVEMRFNYIEKTWIMEAIIGNKDYLLKSYLLR